MNPCDKCLMPSKIKCCHNCKKDAAKCGNWHKCGEDCEKWEAPIQTNADRIRAMSDEELAELIVKNYPMHKWSKQVRDIYFGFDKPRKDTPQRAWLKWLKQPAEEG